MVLPVRSAKRQRCRDKGDAGRLPRHPYNVTSDLLLGDGFCLRAVVGLVGGVSVEEIRCH